MTTAHPSLSGSHRLLKRRLKILQTLNQQTLWKKQVAQEFTASVQTIGRDIDALENDGLLETRLVAPKEHSRTHFIAYRTTDQGRDALDEFLICTSCGDVIQPPEDCRHDYQPLSDGGGD